MGNFDVRILVVDDERPFAAILAQGLTAEGFAVDVAHDGRTGYLLAVGGSYAAVILDLMLPTMSGFAVSARLRAEGVTTPIIVLTAKSGTFDEIEALESGADDYLRKPFSYPVLVARVKTLLRRPVPLAQTMLTVGDLSLDVPRRRVHRGATPIALSDREWAVLEILAHANGTVVSKSDLLLEVWPGEQDDVNLVEARLSALRRKIDAPFGRRSIETVRGGGYRLVDDRPRPDSQPRG